MQFSVQVLLPSELWFPCNLTIRSEHKQEFLDFFDSMGAFLFSDLLISFERVMFTEYDPLCLKFEGVLMRTIKFADEPSVTRFWNHIQKIALLTIIPGQDRAFNINKKEMDPNSQVSKMLSQKRDSRRITQVVPINSIFPDHPTDAIDSYFEFASSSDLAYSSLPMKRISHSQVNDVLSAKEDLLVSSTTMGKKTMYQFWAKKLFPADPSGSLAQYKKLRGQWSLYTNLQWMNNRDMRVYVKQLEEMLDTSNIHSVIVKRIIFDVLVSWYMYQFGEVFSDKKFQLLYLMTKIFILSAPTTDQIYTQMGDSMTFIEACSTVFWAFVGFNENYLDPNSSSYLIPNASQLSDIIRERLAPYSPLFREYLSSPIFNGFEFGYPYLSSLFLGIWSDEDSSLFLTALITSHDVSLFVASFVCSLIFYTREFAKSNDDLFFSLFDSEIYRMNMRLLLYNTDNFLVYIKSRRKANMNALCN